MTEIVGPKFKTVNTMPTMPGFDHLKIKRSTHTGTSCFILFYYTGIRTALK